MSIPRIFLHVIDNSLEKQILQLDIINKLAVTRSDKETSWINQIIAGPEYDIALIEADAFNQGQIGRIHDENLLPEMDFIFLSQGKPNPHLDQMVLRSAGYHFRSPYNLNLISDAISDYLEQIAVNKTSAEQVVSSNMDQFGMLVGSSSVMHDLCRTIRKIASSSANVLIIGESGTGKELVANTIHMASPRFEQPFVAINCGALSPELVDSELFGHIKGAFTGAHKDHQGVFQQAEGGTLFLDEVTEMPLAHQVKLLRVLETGEYRPVGSSQTLKSNVRILAASNRDPMQAIDDEVFREDLYFRLAHFPIRVPPLRERGEDIVGLAKHFLAYRNAQDQQLKDIANETLDIIANYSWPGNVRELKHTLERAFILADDTILPEHLILDSGGQDYEAEQLENVPSGVPLDEIVQHAIVNTLKSNDGNKTDSAKQLGISVKTLYNKLEKYDLTDTVQTQEDEQPQTNNSQSHS
ncbi:sigma-54 interaction domain-containing protein [Alkalimarinus coralli]|uniref:sigma-54 interaction domain-containing protein n=1 Tax=Alkalimarinus coralli TaxID=2935863 RepID=UPI00202B00CA|nr:sigma-54 dependent transcriptional regulator [Alkalimarinus coralli]